MAFGDIEIMDIDGQEVGKVSGTTTLNGIETSQTMYVILKGDYVIDFTLSSYSDEEAALMDDIMSTLSFK
jgi:tRNA A-37 threonylcarbamoyl transferase component Bud32